MSEAIVPARWQELTAYSEAYTCYSSALAAWAAVERADWRRVVDTGLHLTLVEAEDGLFGFSHFPPHLASEVALTRRVGDDAADAGAAILDELERSGRVIVAGDGFRLPWHVAHGRRHMPHWFVLAGSRSKPVVLDPFACRNELGRQEASLEEIEAPALEDVALAHPAGDPVVTLREAFALGGDARPVASGRYRWLVAGEPEQQAPEGAAGPDAVLRLARHFREHGGDAAAYRQADDIWSIARHRAYLAQRAAGESDPALQTWVEAHAQPLAKRWSHLAPLLMQATLALEAGREPRDSVAQTLEELAGREAAAAAAFPGSAERI